MTLNSMLNRVRVDAEAWIDYMLLAEVDGRWRMVNVLWELRA